MRKIINGLRYDTEKSKLIGSVEHSFELYKTPNGRFFLLFWGGEIKPIMVGEAKAHYEELTDILVEYEDVFGESPKEA